MDIKKVQEFYSSEGVCVNESLKNRILENKLNYRDIEFIEKGFMSRAIFTVNQIAEAKSPYLQETVMQLLEMKASGETIDIDWAIAFANDYADVMMAIKELTDDVGLTEVEVYKNFDPTE